MWQVELRFQVFFVKLKGYKEFVQVQDFGDFRVFIEPQLNFFVWDEGIFYI